MIATSLAAKVTSVYKSLLDGSLRMADLQGDAMRAKVEGGAMDAALRDCKHKVEVADAPDGN